jgi:serine/threonine-protein kinase
MAWTPDGRAFVFVGRRGGVQQLYVRELDHKEARALAGTNGAQTPAISPDGGWVAFWSDGAIRKVALAGGPPLVVCDRVADAPDGISWSADERLVYAPLPDGALWQVPSGGGAPTPLTKLLPGEWRHVLPQMLPDGQVVLYTIRRFPWIWSHEEVVAQSLTTGARTVLLDDAVDARYSPSGHLVFLRRGTLLGVSFDPIHLKVRGSPVPLLEGIAQALTGGDSGEVTGAGQFSVSAMGSLAYVSGSRVPYPDADVLSFTRQGTVTAVTVPVRSYARVARLSPDEQHLALLIRTPSEQSVWLYDSTRRVLVKLTAGGVALWPQWTPNGERVTFARNTAGRFELAWQRADGSGSADVLLGKEGFTPSSWSSDGRELLMVTVTGDIWVMSLEQPAPTLRPLIHSPAIEGGPEFAPDGRSVAYDSNESGRFEVYVQPYPGSGQKIQVSVDGGQAPAWNRRGGELFFVGQGDESQGKPPRLMVADVRTSPSLVVGQTRALFEITQGVFSCRPARCYDVAPDGQRFFAIQQRTSAQPAPVRYVSLIQNWFEELKAKVHGK